MATLYFQVRYARASRGVRAFVDISPLISCRIAELVSIRGREIVQNRGTTGAYARLLAGDRHEQGLLGLVTDRMDTPWE